MMTASPASFSHPAWMRAVLAQVPGSSVVVDEPSGSPFLYHAVHLRQWPFPHAASHESPLTPCPLPATMKEPTVAEASTYLNELGRPLLLRSVPVDHPVMKAFEASAGHFKVLRTWQRASLNLSGSFDSWMMENFDHKRRKELKRLKARLGEQGQLSFEALASGGDLTAHQSAFLALEASGWKGRRGTAIGNDPRLVKAFEQGLAAMHSLGKVRFWTMRLDGRPIASLYALVDGGEVMLGKMGFDETLARFSPGVLLIVEATTALFAESGIMRADSNAIPNHPMIDRIWRDRIPCMDVIVAGSAVSPLTFWTVATAYGTKDAVRSLIKRIYLSFSGRRPS